MRLRRAFVVGFAGLCAASPATAPARELPAPGAVVLLGADQLRMPAATSTAGGGLALVGVDALNRPVLTRLRPNGAVDRRFGRRRLDVDLSAAPFIRLLSRRSGLLVVASGQELVLTAATRAGRLDRSFGTGGVVRLPLDLGCQGCAPAAVTPEGGVVVSGRVGLDWVVRRLRPDGQPDPAFGEAGTALLASDGTSTLALGVFADGSTVVLGAGTNPLGGAANTTRLVRLTAAGQVDPAFNGGAPLVLADAGAFPGALRAAPDGSVHVALWSPSGGQEVRRYTPTGARDVAFSAPLRGDATSTITHMLPSPDGGDVLLQTQFGAPFLGGFSPTVALTAVAADGRVAVQRDDRLPFGGGSIPPPQANAGAGSIDGMGFVPAEAAARPGGGAILVGDVGVGHDADAEVDRVAGGTGVVAYDAHLLPDSTFGGERRPARLEVTVPAQRRSRALRLAVRASSPGLATFTIRSSGHRLGAATRALRGGRERVRIPISRRPRALATIRAVARFRDLVASETSARVRARVR
jgi:hypothetical protein